jgi:3-hydroxyisobutyrate dehydrogenase-like beta-hydroxyacid dehydrogenase
MLETVDDPIAQIEVVLKDVDTALDVAHQSRTPMPMTATASEIYRTLVARGFGSAEFDALFQNLGAGGEKGGV